MGTDHVLSKLRMIDLVNGQEGEDHANSYSGNWRLWWEIRSATYEFWSRCHADSQGTDPGKAAEGRTERRLGFGGGMAIISSETHAGILAPCERTYRLDGIQLSANLTCHWSSALEG